MYLKNLIQLQPSNLIVFASILSIKAYSSRASTMSNSFRGTEDSWDEHAAEYAKLMKDGPMMTPIRAMLKSMNSSLPFSSAKAIADVGCGPGPAINELLDVYGQDITATARLVASDFSKGMVEQVELLKDEHVGDSHWDKLETYVWNLMDLDHVPSDSFSHVMGSLVFFMLEDPRKALTGVHRILQNDSIIGLTSWHKVEWLEVIEVASAIVRPDLAAKRKVFELPKAWATTEAVQKELEATGFRDCQVEYVETWLPVDDPSILLRWFVRSKNPGIMRLMEGFNEEELDQVGEEFKKLVAEICPTGPKRLRGIAIAAVARK